MTATLAPDAQALAERLRRAHFPPELNRVPAHITLFHQLPGSRLDEVRRRLKTVTARPAPVVAVRGVRSLGRGVALDLHAPDLALVRDELADGFAGLLIPQDQGGWRPHLTVQNKVTPARARETLALLGREIAPFETRAAALALWRYLDGPWEALGSHAFRGR